MFQWNGDQTGAALVPAIGDEQEFTIRDGSAPGGKRQQTWRFHSRAECLRCHNPWCNTALAFNPLQLDKTLRYAVEPERRSPTRRVSPDLDRAGSETGAPGRTGSQGRSKRPVHAAPGSTERDSA